MGDPEISQMRGGLLLRTTALLEGLAGLGFLLLPSLPLEILFGQAPDKVLGLLVARIAGAALLALATACWWAGKDTANRRAAGLVGALLLYDTLAVLLLLYGGLSLELSGIGLWPAVVGHIALAAWSVAVLMHPAS
ncbi:MAG TPA: hypothetical protein VKB42_20215 [Dongiaceae bacterium]|nr:hypothetical protein [Dongiaceae bacterium]